MPIDGHLALHHILSLQKSWSESIFQFGSLDSNVVELFIENGYVQPASFRIDYTTDYLDSIIKLLEHFKANDCLVIDDKFSPLPEDIAQI